MGEAAGWSEGGLKVNWLWAFWGGLSGNEKFAFLTRMVQICKNAVVVIIKMLQVFTISMFMSYS